MVVIIILGMASTVAVLSWQSMVPNQRFNSAVRELSDVLHSTRSEAIARSRKYEMHYDLDEEIYRVRTPFRPTGGFALLFQLSTLSQSPSFWDPFQK